MIRPRSPQVARDELPYIPISAAVLESLDVGPCCLQNRLLRFCTTSLPHASLTPHTDTCLFIFALIPIFERTLIHVNCSPRSCSYIVPSLSLYHYALFFMACSVRILWTVM